MRMNDAILQSLAVAGSVHAPPPAPPPPHSPAILHTAVIAAAQVSPMMHTVDSLMSPANPTLMGNGNSAASSPAVGDATSWNEFQRMHKVIAAPALCLRTFV